MQRELEDARQALKAAQADAKSAQERAMAATNSRKEQVASDQLRLQVNMASSWPPLRCLCH